MKSYEHDDKISLVNYSYFVEDFIPDKLQKAREFGFLRGAISSSPYGAPAPTYSYAVCMLHMLFSNSIIWSGCA